MPRGGFRPGAGRPKGSKSKPKAPKKAAAALRRVALPPPPKVAAEAPARVEPAIADEAPLDYMLRIMRDPEADPARRDRMAALAAPYVHARAADKAPGKKQQRKDAAAGAGAGSGWGDDLTFSAARN